MTTSVTHARYARWDGVGRGFSVVGVDVPATPGPGEVLVAIDLATVCGSDRHTVAGHRPSPAPGVLGHEQVGTVVGAGAGACTVGGEPVAVGQRVVFSVAASCGDCARCRRGVPQKCARLHKYGHEPLDASHPLTGGFASHVVVRPGTAIVPVPPDVPDAVACPASCATATVAAALAAGPADLDGARVLVTGAGMLGLTAAAMASSRGGHVTLADPGASRRRTATRFGATATVEPGDPVAPVDLALEMSGARAAVRSCLDALDVGGTAVLVGSVSPGPRVEVDPEAVVRGLHTVTGVHNYRPADLRTAVDFLAAHHATFPFADLVVGRHGLTDLARAFAADAARVGVVPVA